MEVALERDMKTIIKKERFQSKMIKYISKVGKPLLFTLPIILLIITLLAFFAVGALDFTLKVIYLIVIVIYAFNSFMLLLGASSTESSLKMRLKFERKRGRPIDSLDGFDLLSSSVKRVTNLLKFISLICFTAIILFVVMLIIDILDIGFAAAGFALIGLGLSILIRSLNLNIHDVNGLQDFYKPTTHSLFLDNFFAEIFSNHLDPVTFLKWDEYLAELNKILNPEFIQKIKAQEAEELPITFAIEKLLFLYYLKFQEVLTKDQILQELKEIINVDSINFDVEKGIFMEGAWYFSIKDIYKLFNYIKKYNPGFFNIIDRLQLELADNIERVSKDPIYMDSSAQEVVYLNSELNIMVFLYNNSPEDKRYTIKIVAPGFDPTEMVLDIKVEGRGTFTIPNKPIPLISSEERDIAGVLSTMLENGDTIWLTLEPRETGEQTVQVFLLSSDGTIIEGKTRTVKVTKNMKDYLKKFSSIGSLLGGLAVPLAKILPYVLIA
jgi:translation elongation factor EF-1beta